MSSARGFIVGMVVGVAVTIGLFLLMQELIKPDRITAEEVYSNGVPTITPDEPDEEIRPNPIPPRPTNDKPPETPDPVKPKFPRGTNDGIATGRTPYVPIPTVPTEGFRGNEPTPIVRLAPVYPRRAAQQGLEGDVLVEFDIDEDGNVINERVVSSTNSMFDSAALRSVRRWKYAPQVEGGQPIIRRGVRVIIEFRLEEED